ncbi:hypothetical protein HK102_012983, partial [Quaeritorhiza haematococci]
HGREGRVRAGRCEESDAAIEDYPGRSDAMPSLAEAGDGRVKFASERLLVAHRLAAVSATPGPPGIIEFGRRDRSHRLDDAAVLQKDRDRTRQFVHRFQERATRGRLDEAAPELEPSPAFQSPDQDPGQLAMQRRGQAQILIAVKGPGRLMLAVDRLVVLAADRQEGLDDRRVVGAARKPGVGEDRHRLVDQHGEPERSSERRQRRAHHVARPGQRLEDPGDRPPARPLGADHHQHLLEPGLRGQEVAEPFLQGRDAVRVVGPHVPQE